MVGVFRTSILLQRFTFYESSWCSFSGDTVPDDNLVMVGTGSTLLIHESSLGDDELGLAQAMSTRHSTFGQALDVGRR